MGHPQVIASGGNAPYEYRLENGSWQDSPVFNNITDCFYVVFVREKTACNNQPATSVRFINHPVFFTPNNDGFNDIWNITGVEEKSEAQITIYDRYGRIIDIQPIAMAMVGTVYIMVVKCRRLIIGLQLNILIQKTSLEFIDHTSH